MPDAPDTIRTTVADLGRRLYRRALILDDAESLTDPNGKPISWRLDTRMPMLEAELHREVGHVLVERMKERGIRQVAGFGYGAFPMVCAVLGQADPSVRGGFVREQRKGYGRNRLIEGPLIPEEPIILLDDILNSGQSAIKTIRLLRADGFNVEGLITLFCFTWGGGREKCQAQGLWTESLLDLNLNERTGTATRSDSS